MPPIGAPMGAPIGIPCPMPWFIAWLTPTPVPLAGAVLKGEPVIPMDEDATGGCAPNPPAEPKLAALVEPVEACIVAEVDATKSNPANGSDEPDALGAACGLW